METKQHGGQRANSGRKPLPDTVKKKTSVIRIDAELLPLVEKLKQGLPITQNQVWKQTTALSEDDLREQANYIERLTADNAQLSAQVQQLEKQLQKIKSNNEILQIDKENLERDILNMNARNERLEQELRAAKTKGNGLLQAELDRYKAGNTKLVEQRDNEHNQVIQLQTELRTAKTEPAKLKAELSAAKRELSKQKTRFCQCLTAAGHQCTKPATHENKHNGFILWTCEQHYQSVINAN